MGCELFRPPPFTRAFTPTERLPPTAHAYSQELLDRATAPGSSIALGYFERGTIPDAAGNPVPVVRQFTHHTNCNGTPGCCPAVTLFHDTAPAGVPDTGVTVPAIDWAAVAVTGAAAAAVVTLFVLALHHARRHDQDRRQDRRHDRRLR